MRNGLIFAILVILLLAANGAEARVVDESRPIASDARVEFSAVTGKFEVRAVSGNQMRLTGRLGEGVEELVIDGERDAWYIEVKHKDNHRGRGGNTELLLEVPASVSLQASVVSGDFDVRGLEGARLALNAVSGTLDVQARPAMMELSTVSGNVTVRGNQIRRAAFSAVRGIVSVP
jgi:hypothetical protein